MRQLDAQLRYYFHLDPDTLDEYTWVQRVKELEWVRSKEAKA